MKRLLSWFRGPVHVHLDATVLPAGATVILRLRDPVPASALEEVSRQLQGIGRDADVTFLIVPATVSVELRQTDQGADDLQSMLIERRDFSESEMRSFFDLAPGKVSQ